MFHSIIARKDVWHRAIWVTTQPQDRDPCSRGKTSVSLIPALSIIRTNNEDPELLGSSSVICHVSRTIGVVGEVGPVVTDKEIRLNNISQGCLVSLWCRVGSRSQLRTVCVASSACQTNLYINAAIARTWPVEIMIQMLLLWWWHSSNKDTMHLIMKILNLIHSMGEAINCQHHIHIS